MVKELQPNCLINSRIGQGLGDFTTLGDSQFPDQILGGLWESIDTHNNSWAFSKLDINWKSDIEYSCDAESDLKEGLIGIDDVMQPFLPVYTGDTWGQTSDEGGRAMPRFMTRRIGMVRIASPGKHSLHIQLNDDDSGGWIRLGKVTLTPVL